ncbi:flocculation protein FLO11 isoform X2 [Drosophila willistoni]|uniref:flocculation protein FLO11 isoform X2 n=1 Tax=Drosophila willistoni TaxID=7260 RepID=UPI000C26D7DA|nr:flocculation protein FLO11 isoform X2 [Drosophila willistoni]
MGMVETAAADLLEANTYTYLIVSANLTLCFIVMLGACLCCKKRIPKNDMLGLEGMVKLKNPDEVIVVTNLVGSESQAELNASTVSNADSEKRSSTAAHRSLPDIPVAESNDNGSELYETVADKQLVDARNAHSQSPQPSMKKQTSVSQHSSISQADDVSSPYSRVKGLPHDYAKVRATEHPYAQLNAPSTSNAAQGAAAAAAAAATAASSSGADRLDQHIEGTREHQNDVAQPQSEIPAASAIAGMISASQDLPYMTPPIANQHFSGDSQDSSKGYTSISVREPLANILAQQPPGKPPTRNPTLSRDVNDSHYATVSDDSDETYAAIEDPNNRHLPNATDIYTSGSETYAQIQPMQANPIVVAVEINNSSSLPSTSPVAASSGPIGSTHRPSSSSTDHPLPVPPPVDSLRAQMHSRQASSSSNNSSSVCNLGSPKPEKRQANSPLPPTPKSSIVQPHHLHATTSSSSNLTSGRNSVISVIEAGGDGIELESAESSPQRKHSKSLSPSKESDGNRNIEGMYAKVMKKHKFSRNSPSSPNNSPILIRKQQQQQPHQDILGVSPLDGTADTQKSRVRSNSYSAKDHGYETIPADGHNHVIHENRKSDCYAANMLQKERQQEAAATTIITATTTATSTAVTAINKHYETISQPPPPPPPLPVSSSNDPGYEQLQPHSVVNENDTKKFDYDPNYEELKSRAHSDDGYAKVLEKKRPPGDTSGYSTIPEADANHNYASILETKANAAMDIDHYARISEKAISNSSTSGSHLALTSPTSLTSSSLTTSNTTPISSQYESLTGTGSETDPNYESVCYLNTTRTTTTTTVTSTSSNDTLEHPYERLQTDLESETQASSPLSAATTSTPSEQLLVDDYFQV